MAEDTTIGKTMNELVEEFKNAQVKDRKNIIIQAAELQDSEEREEKRDEDLKKLLDDGIKKQMGETGFRGIIKNTTENFTKLLTEQKSMGQLFGDLKSSFSSDISLVTGALSPLMAIPGISTAIGIIKLALGLLWKGIQKFWAWTQAMRLRDQGIARLAGLSREGAESGPLMVTASAETKGFFTVIGGFLKKLKIAFLGLGAVVLAFFAHLTRPFRAVVGFVWRNTVGRLWRGIVLPAWRLTLGRLFTGLSRFLTRSFGLGIDWKPVVGTGERTKKWARRILTFWRWFTGLFSRMGPILTQIANMPVIRHLLAFVRFLVRKVIAPILVAIGAFRGFMDTEGGLGDRLLGGVLGGIGAFVDFFVMWIGDILREGVAWLAGLLGFTATQQWLKSWSFSDIWNDIWANFEYLMLNIGQLWTALTEGLRVALNEIWPGGVTPQEAFKEKFNEIMSERGPREGGPVTGTGSSLEAKYNPTGESIENYERDTGKDTGFEARRERAMANQQNNIITNNSTNISLLSSSDPGDQMAAALAGQYE